MVYIYDLPEFKIPKEFQDWLVWAWNWQQASDWSVVDLSGNWHNWTPNWWVILWRKNNAHFMQFDGSNGTYINLNTYIDWNVYTIWWYYKINSSDNYWVLLSQGTTTNSTNKFNMETNWWNKISFVVHNTDWNGDSVDVDWPWNDWKWHFIIWTFDWSTVKLYVDWSLVWTTVFSWTPVDTSDTLRISAYSNNDAYNINWDVWIIFTYNKILSGNKIQKMYEYFRQWYHD